METELRAGVQPLEELLDEHRHVRGKLSGLWAKYGPGGVAEHLRKAELARIVEYLRAMAIAEERKTTEAALDAAAHSHKQYLDFVAQMTKERAEYYELHAQLQEVEWKVNRGQAMMRYATVELQGAGV